MQTPSFKRKLAAVPLALAACLVLTAAASCGSRTGLLPLPEGADASRDRALMPDVPELPDAAEDFPAINTFSPDVPVINPCPDAAATLIYVIGTSGRLYSFDPTTYAFATIGAISCPDSVGSQPFSMAVDRQGVAYVIFELQDYATALYRVDTRTAECSATTYRRGRSRA